MEIYKERLGVTMTRCVLEFLTDEENYRLFSFQDITTLSWKIRDPEPLINWAANNGRVDVFNYIHKKIYINQ